MWCRKSSFYNREKKRKPEKEYYDEGRREMEWESSYAELTAKKE